MKITKNKALELYGIGVDNFNDVKIKDTLILINKKIIQHINDMQNNKAKDKVDIFFEKANKIASTLDLIIKDIDMHDPSHAGKCMYLFYMDIYGLMSKLRYDDKKDAFDNIIKKINELNELLN